MRIENLKKNFFLIFLQKKETNQT